MAGTRRYAPILVAFGTGYVACVLATLLGARALAQGAEPCGRELTGWNSMQTQHILLADGQDRCLTIEAHIADDPIERAAGYQHVCPEVIANSAVLFAFPTPGRRAFHMRNVYAPLDIAFFDAAGTMVDRATMRPEPPGFTGKRRLYHSRSPYLYALEARRGYFSAQGLIPGRARLLVERLP